MTPARPNVLLIVLDTARADAFEPYGAGDGASPALAQLARRGVAVPVAVAPSNWTMPSHASMFAGDIPRAIGLATAPSGKPRKCRPILESLAPRLLPEVLRRAGYATSAVSANAWISRTTGFATGFERFEKAGSARQKRITDRRLRARLAWALDGLRATADDGAEEAERVIASWIGEPQTRPFFWFVNLLECHSPYMPPRPYNDLSALQRLRIGEDARRHLTLTGVWRACLGGSTVPDDVLSRMRHLYGRSIRQMDDWLARLLERLDGAGLLEDTIVIITSDHGENLGESGLLGHAFSLDDRLIRVPLVVAPDTLGFDEPASLASLPQRLAQAIGLSDHPWQRDPVPSGVAVSEYGSPAGRGDPRVQRLVSEWKIDESTIRRMTEPAICATDGRLKLVRHGGVETLFDTEADPLETRPADPAANGDGRSAAVAALRKALDEAEATAAPAPVAAPAPAATPEEEADIEERLRLLGYL